MIEPLSIRHNASTTVTVRLFRPSDQKVFDFDDDTWETNVAACTTPLLTLTENTDVGSTSKSIYRNTIDLDDVNSSATPMYVEFQFLDGTTILGEEGEWILSGAKTTEAIEERVTEARVAKLDVSGALAHSDAASTYKADITSLATAAALGGVITTLAAMEIIINNLPDDGELTSLEVLVNDFATAALAKFATIDTGESTAVSQSVAELAQGGGSTTIVGPLIGTVSVEDFIGDPVNLAVFQAEARLHLITVVDRDGVPIDLSSIDMRFVIETNVESPVTLLTLTPTVTGDNNEIANVQISEIQSAALPATRHEWKLWNDDTTQVMMHGIYSVLPSTG